MDFFKRLFVKGKTAVPEGVKTAPLDPSTLRSPAELPLANRLILGMAQSTGMERTHNEDALFAMLGAAAGEEPLPEFGLFIVADGMGGHRSGEVASSISARTVAHRLTRDAVLRMMEDENRSDMAPLQDVVRVALEEANQLVVERVPGGGTTLTVALLLGQQITFGHVGDSRAYLIRPDQTRVLTRDHSLVKRLEELGQLTPEEAELHPQRNVLYRAIGQGANLEVDVMTIPVTHGSYLMLCSDGLWGVIPDREIERIVLGAADPQTACERLVAAANAAGGPDNITALLVYFPPR
jgi:protein phosphatase